MRILLPLIASTLLLGACSQQEEAKPVSLKADVMPILQANCLECHDSPDAKGTKKSGLRMDTHAGLIQGTKYGPVIDAGYADTSVLNQVVEGRVDKSIKMPHGGKELTEAEQQILRDWVEQGAKDN